MCKTNKDTRLWMLIILMCVFLDFWWSNEKTLYTTSTGSSHGLIDKGGFIEHVVQTLQCKNSHQIIWECFILLNVVYVDAIAFIWAWHFCVKHILMEKRLACFQHIPIPDFSHNLACNHGILQLLLLLLLPRHQIWSWSFVMCSSVTHRMKLV